MDRMCKSQPDNQLIGRPMTDEEVNHIVKTENFLKFFSSATKLVEVAITEETTLGLDSYSDDLMTEDANELVSVQRLFHDEKWSRGRPMTSIDWYSYTFVRFPNLLIHGNRGTRLHPSLSP